MLFAIFLYLYNNNVFIIINYIKNIFLKIIKCHLKKKYSKCNFKCNF